MLDGDLCPKGKTSGTFGGSNSHPELADANCGQTVIFMLANTNQKLSRLAIWILPNYFGGPCYYAAGHIFRVDSNQNVQPTQKNVQPKFQKCSVPTTNACQIG